MKDINTYGQLKEAVKIWLARKDSNTLSNIPMFINMALKTFVRMGKLPYYEVMVNMDVVEGYDYVTLPQDFLSAKHVAVNEMPYNRMDTESFLRIVNDGYELITNPDGSVQGTSSGSGHFFTRIGGNLYFSPAITPGDKVQLIYQRDIPEFTDDFKEEYAIMVASDILLYLSLRHAATFLRDRDQEQYWTSKAQEAWETLKAQLDQAEWSGSALIVPQFTT